MVCKDDGFWATLPGHTRVPFDVAVREALAAEDAGPLAGRAWERLVRTVARRVQ